MQEFFVAEESWAAGVDIGGTKINVIQVDRSGAAGKEVKVSTNVNGGPEVITREIVGAIAKLTEAVGSPPGAIGIGIAGQVERNTGVIKFAPNLRWSNIPLANHIQQLLPIPVVITNDVRAATWGEWLHGAGVGCEHLLCVFIGTGIGGGIVAAGNMLEGFNNTAGEIGHIQVALQGPECTCGNWGCMEAYAGGWAIAKEARSAIRSSPLEGEALLKQIGCRIDEVNAMHVMEAAYAGNPIAAKVAESAIDALAAGISGLINSISPERVIFGGGVVEGNPWLIERVALKLKKHTLAAAFEGVTIAKAKLNNDAGAIGAAALALRGCLISKGSSRN